MSRASTIKSLQTVQTELEFLYESNVIRKEGYQNDLYVLPPKSFSRKEAPSPLGGYRLATHGYNAEKEGDLSFQKEIHGL